MQKIDLRRIPNILLLGLFIILMLLRASSDHEANGHYNGDYASEYSFKYAAENFKKYGYFPLKFGLVINPLDVSPAEKQPDFYTTYPPYPALLLSVPYVLGFDIFGSRVLAILISLTGLLFGCSAIKTILHVMGLKDKWWDSLILFLLLFSTAALTYSDTLFVQSVMVATIWICLWWTVKYLYLESSLWLGCLLLALQVMVSFEWIIPMFLILCWCAYIRNRQNFWKNFLIIGFVGVVIPVLFRGFHNIWILGGFQDVWELLVSRFRLRVGIEEVANYSVMRHAFKVLGGTGWYSGPVLFLTATLLAPLFFKRMKDVKNLKPLLILWVFASVIWQILMHQHGYIHVYTYLPLAMALIVIAAIGLPILYEKNKKQLFGIIVLSHVLWTGSVILTEIILPFDYTWVERLTNRLCEEDRKYIQGRYQTNQSFQFNLVIHSVKNQKFIPPSCDSDSRRARDLLILSTYLIRNKLPVIFAEQR